MEKGSKSKKNKNKRSILDVAKQETLKPLRYHSKEDLDFTNSVINYFKWCFVDNNANAESNLTDWWRQKIICVRSKKIKNEDEEGWFPDLLRGKCFIETYFINEETEEKWQERKRDLNHLYSSAIATYHEAMLANAIKRITPEFKSQIIREMKEKGN